MVKYGLLCLIARAIKAQLRRVQAMLDLPPGLLPMIESYTDPLEFGCGYVTTLLIGQLSKPRGITFCSTKRRSLDNDDSDDDDDEDNCLLVSCWGSNTIHRVTYDPFTDFNCRPNPHRVVDNSTPSSA
jgi:hypothetical protein